MGWVAWECSACMRHTDHSPAQGCTKVQLEQRAGRSTFLALPDPAVGLPKGNHAQGSS